MRNNKRELVYVDIKVSDEPETVLRSIYTILENSFNTKKCTFYRILNESESDGYIHDTLVAIYRVYHAYIVLGGDIINTNCVNIKLGPLFGKTNRRIEYIDESPNMNALRICSIIRYTLADKCGLRYVCRINGFECVTNCPLIMIWNLLKMWRSSSEHSVDIKHIPTGRHIGGVPRYTNLVLVDITSSPRQHIYYRTR